MMVGRVAPRAPSFKDMSLENLLVPMNAFGNPGGCADSRRARSDAPHLWHLGAQHLPSRSEA